VLERALRRLERKIRRRLAFACDMAALDAGALDDLRIARVDDLREVIVRDNS